jgi:flavin reductase (DIM6/NTAB) family NADH-FMN oxidoreductase RutF
MSKVSKQINDTIDVPEFTSRDFRDVMGGFATGITVASCLDENGTPVGLTVNSFTSVSLNPPLVSICIDRGITSFPAFMASDHIAVSILSADQRDISMRFSDPRAKRWAAIDHNLGGIGNCPIIKDPLGWVEAKIVNRYDGGDHVIILAEVLDLYLNPDKDPLLYFRSNYRTLKTD